LALDGRKRKIIQIKIKAESGKQGKSRARVLGPSNLFPDSLLLSRRAFHFMFMLCVVGCDVGPSLINVVL